jgi:hypothetical protein
VPILICRKKSISIRYALKNEWLTEYLQDRQSFALWYQGPFKESALLMVATQRIQVILAWKIRPLSSLTSSSRYPEVSTRKAPLQQNIVDKQDQRWMLPP